MKNIEITEENKEIYEEYALVRDPWVVLKNGEYNKNFKKWVGITVFVDAIILLAFALPIDFLLSGITSGALKALITCGMAASGLVIVVSENVHLLKNYEKNNLATFKKLHPEFDTTLSLEKVKKAIYEYQNIIHHDKKMNPKTINLSHLKEEDELKIISSFDMVSAERKDEYLERIETFLKEEELSEVEEDDTVKVMKKIYKDSIR